MRKSASLNTEQLIQEFSKLSTTEMFKLMDGLSETKSKDFEIVKQRYINSDYEKRLESLKINQKCPYCASIFYKGKGVRNGIHRFKCQCGKSFTHFTNTILERTKYGWEIWVAILQMYLNDIHVRDMQRTLQDDYNCLRIDLKTIWLIKMKLIYAMSQIPMPKLYGVINIDETSFRESQKGSRTLVSTISKKDERLPRRGRKPSKLGVMGPEFATVTCAVDSTYHVVAKVVCYGRMKDALFEAEFHDHLQDPAFICTDANNAYSPYCNKYDIPHYIIPSNYRTIIANAGVIDAGSFDPAERERIKEKNNKILEALYKEHQIDHIENKGYLNYEDFKALKKKYGLNLAYVNNFHSELKELLFTRYKNVPTKYLSFYIGASVYLHNWAIDHKHQPSSLKDAENIFIEILKTNVNYKLADFDAKDADLNKPSPRYVALLKERTENARKATGNSSFKLNEEDGLTSLSIRDLLNSLPRKELNKLGKLYELPRGYATNWVKRALVVELLKQTNIEEQVYKLIYKIREKKTDTEDIEAKSYI